jgi:hypothetical protein
MAEIIEMPAGSDLLGRTLALNLSVCRKFTCRGFFLSPTRVAAMVDHEADQVALRTALLQGRLIDITDQVVKGLNVNGSGHSTVKVEETGMKAYLGYDKDGRLYVVTPKDEAEAEAIEKEIRDTGTLKRAWETAAQFSDVTELPIEPEEDPPRLIFTD